ncbi:MAG: sodium-dependent transporter [Thermoanaerobaculia bacterium]
MPSQTGTPAQTPIWSSRFVAYLATIGAAVGLGSVWRLPYLVGTSGGSAFLLIFVLACLAIATPLLVAEFALGRRSRLSPPDAAGAVAVESGGSRNWNAIGIVGTIACFAITTYYMVVAGWVLAYTWKCASGALVGLDRPAVAAHFQALLANPFELVAWQLAFIAIVAFTSARGVGRGVELATRWRAPMLLILLIGLAGYALATGDVRAGLAFAFAPNFAAITPQVLVAAVGQAFFATGVGMAMMLAYGAYLPRGTSLVRSALGITGSILLVSLLATLMIFPLVFRYGMNPAGGPELVFGVLATVFAEMPGGRIVGTLFFVLLFLSAFTPSLAAYEPMVAWLQQSKGASRRRAVAIVAVAVWAVGLGTVLSFNRWSGWFPLGFLPTFATKTFFDVLDYVASNLLLPLGALATSLLVGWRLRRDILAEELAETTPGAARLCIWLLRYACPLALAAVLISTLL